MILCSGSLHHVKELEHLLSQIKNGLKTDGVFIANEYVGACYNIYPESQISAINNILDGLPNELKINPSQKFRNASIEDVFQRDPTEAVRSILIPTFLRIYFKYVDERKCGGTILHPIYPFLNVETLEKNHILHQSLVNTLIAMDQNYMNEGKSDFSFFICRNQ